MYVKVTTMIGANLLVSSPIKHILRLITEENGENMQGTLKTKTPWT